MLAVFAGPSGSGKTTLAGALRRDYKNAVPLVSYATRRRRDSDTPGEMEFVTPAKFLRMSNSGEFLWTVKPFESRYRYGTLKVDVDKALDDEDAVYLALLTIDTIPILHRYTLSNSKLSRLRCLYLRITDTDELRRRLLQDGGRNNIDARLAEAAYENAAAQKMRDILHVIDAKLPPEEVLERARRIINIL